MFELNVAPLFKMSCADVNVVQYCVLSGSNTNNNTSNTFFTLADVAPLSSLYC